MSIVGEAVKPVKVRMAGIGYASAPDRLETLLGSCVGIAVWDPRAKVAGLAHIVLPECNGRDGPIGKYADIAVPELRKQLLKMGARPKGMVAKIAGGATMFGERSATDVGERNHRAVVALLRQAGIPLLAEHIGGSAGRMVHFTPQDGALKIYIARAIVATI